VDGFCRPVVDIALIGVVVGVRTIGRKHEVGDADARRISESL